MSGSGNARRTRGGRSGCSWRQGDCAGHRGDDGWVLLDVVGANAGEITQCRLNLGRVSTPGLNAADDVGGEVRLSAVAGRVGVVCAAGAEDPGV